MAQRKRRGQIHLAAFGLNSVATFSAAVAADRILGSLREGESGRDGPILWVPVEVNHRMDRPLTAWEIREQIELSIRVGSPRYWPAPPQAQGGVAAVGRA